MNYDGMTDDEALRIQGMTDGPRQVSKITLRPITAESWSWMQTVNIFSPELGDRHQVAAFAFLHSEPVTLIRTMVFKRDLFWAEVSKWIADNATNHTELDPYADAFNEAYNRYSASITISVNPSDGTPGGPKN